MPRFFCDNINNENVNLSEEDVHHIIKVLRMKLGETLMVCDKKGVDYECEIVEINEGVPKLKILSSNKTQSEPSVKVTLYQAIPKGDKFDLITQKSVELGVSEIIPVATSRCVSKWETKAQAKKIARLQKIAFEAAKQSGRGIIPKIGEHASFAQAIEQMKTHKVAIVCYEKFGSRLNEIVDSACDDVAIMIGSEGGFEESEIETAKSAGVKIATLGNLILRCETAPITATSIIMNITKNI